MRLDIDSGCKTTLKHLRNVFPVIYHHFGRYRPIYRKSHFDQNRDFCDFHVFGTIHNMADHMAGNAKKCDQSPEMMSLNPQNMCKYLGLMMIWSYF